MAISFVHVCVCVFVCVCMCVYLLIGGMVNNAIIECWLYKLQLMRRHIFYCFMYTLFFHLQGLQGVQCADQVPLLL